MHPLTGPVIPTTLSALRADNGDGAAIVPSSLVGFLKKIKGFQSLNMELSWRWVLDLLSQHYVLICRAQAF